MELLWARITCAYEQDPVVITGTNDERRMDGEGAQNTLQSEQAQLHMQEKTLRVGK